MVFIAVPNTGDIRTGLVKQLIGLDKNDDVELHFNQARPVDVNRCEIVKTFLETDHDHLIMIDSDIIPPDDVLDLPDKPGDITSPVVFSSQKGVPYPVASVFDTDGELSMYAGEADDILHVDGVGTGCICIHCDVFDGIDEPYFRYRKNDDGTMNTGEDFDFCVRARDADYDIVVDTTMVAGHVSGINLKEYMTNLAMAIESDTDDLGLARSRTERVEL